MDDAELIASLELIFPARQVEGTIVTHDCNECLELARRLTGMTWETLTSAFIEEHNDALPLLSREAYFALLPAWLRQAVAEPNGDAASMILTNLQTACTDGFSVEQARIVLDCARFSTSNNIYGPVDPVNIDTLAAIRKNWSPS